MRQGKIRQGKRPSRLSNGWGAVIILSALWLAGFGGGVALADGLAAPEHETRRFASLLFLIGFLVIPIFYVISPLVASACVLLTSTILYRRVFGSEPLRWWVIPLLIAATIFLVWRVGGFLMASPLIWPGFAFGLLIWHGMERWNGREGLLTGRMLRQRKRTQLALIVGAGLLAYTAFIGARLFALLAAVWIAPPDLGSPPYTVQFDREITLYTLVAVKRFPDAQSCLVPGADATDQGDLNRLDWDRIDTTTEAEVCSFRLLAALGGIERFTGFAVAQGFRVPYPSNPHIELNGNLRVTAVWSIRKNGPKFPTRGLVRYLNAVPYSMSLDATWLADGKTLRFVKIIFTTL